MSDWSRRGFLTAAGAVLAALHATLWGCSESDPDEMLDAALRDWFEPGPADRAGRKVLARGEGWNDAGALRAPLRAQLDDARNPADARRALAEAVSEDFRAGRTLELDGWLVSETEARLYALAALRGTTRAR
jgi:hypothetical protein